MSDVRLNETWKQALHEEFTKDYWQFQSFYFDFGIFDRAIWLYSRFQPPLVFHPNFAGVERIIFADHFNPSFALFAPLYWVTNRREILLIFQAIIVGLSGVIGYYIAKLVVKNKLIQVALVIAYLGFVGLQNALITDFHDATVATLPLMLVFWAIVKKNWAVYYISLLVLLGFKETFAGIGISLGLFMLLREKRFSRHSIATLSISTLWIFVVVYKIIPYFNQNPYFYSNTTQTIHSLNDFVRVWVVPFLKIKTLWFSFLSFGFLPLLYPPLLPAIFENFFERFISLSNTRWDLGLHYSATLTVFMFVSSLFVISYLERKKMTNKAISVGAVLLLCIVFFLHRFILHGPLALAYNPVFYQQTKNLVYLENILKQLPQDGTIMTQNDLALRFSHVKKIYLLDMNYQYFSPDTIIINLTPGQNPNNFFPMSEDHVQVLVQKLLQDKTYSVKKYSDSFYVFTERK